MKLYKGYKLEPLPDYRIETLRWSTKINIILDAGSHQITKDYSSEETYETKGEAENASIIFGQQIIDGKHKNLSAPPR